MLKENEYLKWMTEKSEKQTFRGERIQGFKKVAAEEWGFQSNFVYWLCVTWVLSFDVNG